MSETRRSFEMTLPEDLLALIFLFEKAGYKLYVVGGAVRDAAMGSGPNDYDLATDATPDQVLKLLQGDNSWATNEVGKAFGVVRARTAGLLEGCNHEYEIATFRQDVGRGRRPDSVVFTTIEEDVKRRDLTINALFYDSVHHEIVDLVGGLTDIEAHLIRAVGEPIDRFAEDRLRVLRAIRFAAQLGCDIEARTLAAIVADSSLTGVSPERIRGEFTKAIKSAQSLAALLQSLTDLHMWRHVLPGCQVTSGRCTQFSTRSVPVILALLLDSDTSACRRLSGLKYTADEVAQVRVLLQFRDLEKSTAYRLRKACKAARVTPETLMSYHVDRGLPATSAATAFMRYLKVEPVSGEVLLTEGFAGQNLGEELERRETNVFWRLMNDQ